MMDDPAPVCTLKGQVLPLLEEANYSNLDPIDDDWDHNIYCAPELSAYPVNYLLRIDERELNNMSLNCIRIIKFI